MGKCKDCAQWSHDVRKYNELDAILEDHGIYQAPYRRGYGVCEAAGEGEKAMPKYDGGFTGELLTHADYGCNQFKAK